MRAKRPLVFIFAAPFAAALVAACGMVTGLSDDFTFDGGEGGPSTTGDAAGDAQGGDSGGGDTGAGRDAGENKCTSGQAARAFSAMQGTGTLECRTCLAQSCCTAITNCHNDCGARLQCDLDCTTKGNRANCEQQCTTDKPSPTFSADLLTCAKDSCNTQCGFQ